MHAAALPQGACLLHSRADDGGVLWELEDGAGGPALRPAATAVVGSCEAYVLTRGEAAAAQRPAVPVPLGGGLKTIDHIAAGSAHCIAIATDGAAWSWGANADGQCGHGFAGERLAPLREMRLRDGTVVRDAVLAAAGGSHSAVVTAGGGLLVCGSDLYGQLGSGEAAVEASPWLHALAAAEFDGRAVRHVVAGARHTAVIDDEGRLFCWGANTHAQVQLLAQDDGGSADEADRAAATATATATATNATATLLAAAAESVGALTDVVASPSLALPLPLRAVAGRPGRLRLAAFRAICLAACSRATVALGWCPAPAARRLALVVFGRVPPAARVRACVLPVPAPAPRSPDGGGCGDGDRSGAPAAPAPAPAPPPACAVAWLGSPAPLPSAPHLHVLHIAATAALGSGVQVAWDDARLVVHEAAPSATITLLLPAATAMTATAAPGGAGV